MIGRRGFLLGLLAAPAIIRPGILMPIRPWAKPWLEFTLPWRMSITYEEYARNILQPAMIEDLATYGTSICDLSTVPPKRIPPEEWGILRPASSMDLLPPRPSEDETS